MSRELASREAELEVEGFMAWKKARESADFTTFAPVLEKIIALRKEVAQVTRPEWDTYDACIDIFERGMTASRLAEIFDGLKKDLIPLLDKIRLKLQQQPSLPEALDGSDNWDADTQAKLSSEVSVTTFGGGKTRWSHEQAMVD